MARSADSHTIHDYAAKPALVKKVYAQALDGFELQLKSLIDAQLGR
jgi:hypothetical protein